MKKKVTIKQKNKERLDRLFKENDLVLSHLVYTDNFDFPYRSTEARYTSDYLIENNIISYRRIDLPINLQSKFLHLHGSKKIYMRRGTLKSIERDIIIDEILDI